MYYEVNLGGNKKFYLGKENVKAIEKWLDENCEYTDVDKTTNNVYDDEPSEEDVPSYTVTYAIKDDSDIADFTTDQ